MASIRREMLSFLRKTIKNSSDPGSLTKRKLREKFLEDIGKSSLSADELEAFASAVDSVCGEFQEAGSSSPPLSKKRSYGTASDSDHSSNQSEYDFRSEVVKKVTKRKSKVVKSSRNKKTLAKEDSSSDSEDCKRLENVVNSSGKKAEVAENITRRVGKKDSSSDSEDNQPLVKVTSEQKGNGASSGSETSTYDGDIEDEKVNKTKTNASDDKSTKREDDVNIHEEESKSKIKSAEDDNVSDTESYHSKSDDVKGTRKPSQAMTSSDSEESEPLVNLITASKVKSSSDGDSDDEVLAKVQKKSNDEKKSRMKRKRVSKSCGNDSGSESSEKSDKNKSSAEKKKQKKSSELDSSVDFRNEPKSAEKKESEKRNTGKDDPKVVRMKRYIKAAGMRLMYTKLFEKCKSVKSKVQKLQDVLEEAGLKGKPTLEKCKRLQKKREKRRELAELDPHNILMNDEGRRPTRRRTGNPFESPASIPRTPSQSTSDNPMKRAFSRLKGIVDSEESSD